ncbi:MAG: transporter, family, 3-phenylpropionic acid transporter [Alphaproteobacteria bacterium]|jgi:PPP family 3-phenylpropionic acid transporter|nr:transporter, family, 3-phenylpropionic acid transporter [Alphaproteobacteria bacterium]
MPRNPQQSTGQDFARRLATLYAALFVTLGVQLPFLPVWLAAKGLDAQAIGLVLAVPMLARVFAIPMATRVADRRDALRAVIVVLSGVAVAGYGVLGLAEGLVAIVAAYAAASAAYAPVMLLADAYALRGLARWGLAYGPVRLWGSAAFIAASFAAGALLDLIAPRDLIWLVVAAMGLSVVAACALAPVGAPMTAAAAAPPPAGILLRDPRFLTVAAAASLIQASHAMYYGFSTIEWQAAGFGGTTIGALWALGVLAEIALFAISGRLPFTPTTLILVGALGAVVRWSAMALAPPAAALPALQCLHALSFGATHLGALGFLARAAPPGLGATAQGYLGVASGLVMAVAMGVCGVLYGRFGAAAYGAMAVAALAGGLCALAARRMTDKT